MLRSGRTFIDMSWNRALDALIVWTYRPGTERLIVACRLVLVAFAIDALIVSGAALIVYLIVLMLREVVFGA